MIVEKDPPRLGDFFREAPPVSAADSKCFSNTISQFESANLQTRWTFEADPLPRLGGRFPPVCAGVVEKAHDFVLKHFSLANFNTDSRRCCFDYARGRAAEAMVKRGFVVRRFCIQRDRDRYDAFLLGHAASIHNGNWCLAAMPGVGEDIERGMAGTAMWCQRMGFNVLIINGPGSGRSEGRVNWDRLGAAQESGLQFLEKVVDAQRILMVRAGWIGGPAMGRAILNHDFSEEEPPLSRRYCCLSIHTFDQLIHTNLPGKQLLRLVGLDTAAPVRSSTRLEGMGIPEVLVETCTQSDSAGRIYPLEERQFCSTSEWMPRSSSLGRALVAAGHTAHKVFMGYPETQLAGTMEPEFWRGQMVVELADILSRTGPGRGREQLDSFIDFIFDTLSDWPTAATDGQPVTQRLRQLIAHALGEVGGGDGLVPDECLQVYLDYAKRYLVQLVVSRLLQEWLEDGRQETQAELARTAYNCCKAMGFRSNTRWVGGQQDSWLSILYKVIQHKIFDYHLQEELLRQLGD